jgi:hypothetical protein
MELVARQAHQQPLEPQTLVEVVVVLETYPHQPTQLLVQVVAVS